MSVLNAWRGWPAKPFRSQVPDKPAGSRAPVAPRLPGRRRARNPRDISFCGHAILQEGLLSFTMRLPMRDFTIIPWLPVSHTSGSTPASRWACRTARWPARCAWSTPFPAPSRMRTLRPSGTWPVSWRTNSRPSAWPWRTAWRAFNRRGFFTAPAKTLPRNEPAGCVVQPHLFRSGQVQTG